MRIALLHPTYWPEVRRGSERLAHDLGLTLAARGHEVTVLTAHDGPGAVAEEHGVVVDRARRPSRRLGLHLYEDHLENAPSIVRRLLRGGFELAHALYPADGWAAAIARRLGGPPVVLSIHGILDRPWLVARRRRAEMIRAAAAAAAATTTLSEAAAAPLRRYALGDPLVLPGGVLAERFAGPRTSPGEPLLLCPASLGDPRKRGPQLLEAFARVRDQLGDARLLLAGGRDPFTRYELPSLPPGAEAVDAGPERLAELYRSASVTVLPSLNEAFGLVLVESLAAGTPVVAARSGACPEVVADDVGRLFEPDDVGDLARAINAAIELAGQPETAERCRAHADRWDWGTVVERYEAVYTGAVGSGR
ncbi:MAG: glycosyltransferase family 4 protein [Solirubrobacterales bacterium]